MDYADDTMIIHIIGPLGMLIKNAFFLKHQKENPVCWIQSLKIATAC
jgi:hypothetical protein